ncbi:hypothetical protein ACTXT7_010334 [Hymenolepis weldensis]
MNYDRGILHQRLTFSATCTSIKASEFPIAKCLEILVSTTCPLLNETLFKLQKYRISTTVQLSSNLKQ